MNRFRKAVPSCVVIAVFAGCATGIHGRHDPADGSAPPPREAAELTFSEFFVTPVGPRGLTPTEKLLRLDGKRVRLLGYMVQQERRMPGRFLLTSRPVRVHEEHYGLADDLPPATVHVLMPSQTDQLVPYTPRPLHLTGMLSVGNREEPDGRISIVRLILDSPPPGLDL